MAGARGLASWWSSPPPAVGVEFSAAGVAAVAVEANGAATVVTRHAFVPLPAGALVPGLNAANIADRDAVVAALRQALDAVGRPRRVAVAIPDVVSRLTIVRLETVPEKVLERDQLLRWHVRKAAPFDVDAAQVSIAPGRALPDGAREFIVAVARRDIVEEYENVCAACSAHAGVVDLASSALLHVAGADARRAGGDWMLVHLAGAYASLAIVRQDVPIFFRTRGPDAEGSLADTVHQAAMYFEDRLGGERLGALVVAGAADDEDAGRALETAVGARWGVRVERLEFPASVQLADRIGVTPDVVARYAAAAGVVAREW